MDDLAKVVEFAAIKRGHAVHTGHYNHADIQADIGIEEGDVLGWITQVGCDFVPADKADIGEGRAILLRDQGDK